MIFRLLITLLFISLCSCSTDESEETDKKDKLTENEKNEKFAVKSEEWQKQKKLIDQKLSSHNQAFVEATRPELQVDMEKFKAVQQNAVKGDPDYQYSLGMCYKYGYGVKADYNKALYWFKKAADQGHKQAERVYLFMVRRK